MGDWSLGAANNPTSNMFFRGRVRLAYVILVNTRRKSWIESKWNLLSNYKKHEADSEIPKSWPWGRKKIQADL